MTVEERFAALEHYTSGLGEMFRREREEDRALWREMKRETDERFREVAEAIRSLTAEASERDRITDARFRETDAQIRQTNEAVRVMGERVDKLVSGMGAYMSRSK